MTVDPTTRGVKSNQWNQSLITCTEEEMKKKGKKNVIRYSHYASVTKNCTQWMRLRIYDSAKRKKMPFLIGIKIFL